jgi:hypothetical protein
MPVLTEVHITLNPRVHLCVRLAGSLAPGHPILRCGAFVRRRPRRDASRARPASDRGRGGGVSRSPERRIRQHQGEEAARPGSRRHAQHHGPRRCAPLRQTTPRCRLHMLSSSCSRSPGWGSVGVSQTATAGRVD